MLLRLLGAAALACDLASAFRDTSPFFLFSTSQLDTSKNPIQHVVKARDVESYTATLLRECPSDTYIFVSQPGGTIPRHGPVPQSIIVDFPSLPVEADERASTLAKHDSYLNALVASLPNEEYTVIYTTTTPAEDQRVSEIIHQAQYYEMDEPYPSGMHTDLKRDLRAYPRASNSSNLDSKLPLFEKYQFLSSGIFMGLTVTVLLLLILYIAVSAISGLEVSYMAFSKEMGPAAQKKQQQ
ncbi:hypothetical protein H2203_001534 [Taxawa tesnikishii (nom. ined.)]|nr:hypothetical protein H2203_001534 [Dothideales sp. JES 119]